MREFHRIIDAQADHMQGLIGNLLDAGRIEAGTLSVDPSPRSWRRSSTGRATRSSTAAPGTPSRSTCRPASPR